MRSLALAIEVIPCRSPQRCFPGTGLEVGVEDVEAGVVDRLLTDTKIRVVAPPVAERVMC